MDVFVSFFGVLYLVRARWEGEDMLRWIPTKRGLLLNSSIVSWLVMMDFVSHGRFLSGWHFLLDWQPLGRS